MRWIPEKKPVSVGLQVVVVLAQLLHRSKAINQVLSFRGSSDDNDGHLHRRGRSNGGHGVNLSSEDVEDEEGFLKLVQFHHGYNVHEYPAPVNGTPLRVDFQVCQAFQEE